LTYFIGRLKGILNCSTPAVFTGGRRTGRNGMEFLANSVVMPSENYVAWNGLGLASMDISNVQLFQSVGVIGRPRSGTLCIRHDVKREF
jgi:hypothetical protein